MSLPAIKPLSAQSVGVWTAAQEDVTGDMALSEVPNPAGLSLASSLREAQKGFLGVGDQVALSIVIWEDAELEYRQWEPVSGIYTVSAEGTLTLPLVGSLPAVNVSREELSLEIAGILQNRAQMVETPVVTLNIAAYAPFFVLGDVARPGEFEARPDRTVYQAFAMAGGAPRLAGGLDSNVRSLMIDSGTLSQLRREILRAEVSAARYRAMRDDAERITLPEDLTHPDGAAALQRVIEGEQQQLDARREAKALEVENLEGLKELLNTEIASLEEKLDGLSTQIDLAQENLDNMLSLKESGLARSVQIRDAQESLFDVESQQIDIETAIFRARQRHQEAERDILALRSRDKVEAARELQVLQGEIEELRLRRETYGALVEAAGGESSTLMDQVATFYFLTRNGDAAGEKRVEPDTLIGRGDVLRIERVVLEGDDLPEVLSEAAPTIRSEVQEEVQPEVQPETQVVTQPETQVVTSEHDVSLKGPGEGIRPLLRQE
ncbi:polysaccharide biosynthesis/export family protein [Celeribacter naphthalenivorans]|uniref:polysaccharide biosynthesis/export family protein n=1 Tax=Celeribacter naphthalenivorans TaxID=1614694 RepID=UPI001CFC1D96|nr:polysaccharide biosynthesis/export family protein [Celeribacter naphthalenivorans]